MSQCVPSWDIEDPPPFSAAAPQLLLHHDPHGLSSAVAVPTSDDFDVAELTWKDGSLSLLGLPHPRVGKRVPRYPSAAAAGGFGCGTLECIVDQATRAPRLSRPSLTSDHVAWSGGEHADALVPSSAVEEPAPGKKRARVTDEWNCASQGSVAPAETGNAGETPVTGDTCVMTGVGGVGMEELGFSTTPTGSPGSAGDQVYVGGDTPEADNGRFGGGIPSAVEDRDSVILSLRSQPITREGLGQTRIRSSISTNWSRAAAVHNQSERKRRDRINQRMKTLQKLLPKSNKTDKASVLEEAIEYLKLLQAQVQMMSRMSPIPPMMLPITMQQQQMQMAMMAAQMGLGLGIMDPSLLSRSAHTGPQPVLHPSAFFPFSPVGTGTWDATPADGMPQVVDGRGVPGMFSAYLGCPAQQVYQQTHGANQKT